MNYRISLVLIVLLIAGCKDKVPGVKKQVSEYLVGFDEFLQLASAPNTKIIDFRKPELYAQGHIPGALNIWRADIESSEYPYRGMMAKKEVVEALFSSLGIEKNDTLLVYDTDDLCNASRFWWLLQNYGFTRIKMLQGGYAILKEKVTISTKTPDIIPSQFTFTDPPEKKLLISKEDVLASLEKAIILDTRTPDEFSGKRQKKGAFNGGRIPNSISIDWATAINYHGDKSLKPIEQLEKIYGVLVPAKKDTIIVYCHTGVRSAHTIFVLTEILGYENVKNYDGSWSEWSYFSELPFEKDSITTIRQ